MSERSATSCGRTPHLLAVSSALAVRWITGQPGLAVDRSGVFRNAASATVTRGPARYLTMALALVAVSAAAAKRLDFTVTDKSQSADTETAVGQPVVSELLLTEM